MPARPAPLLVLGLLLLPSLAPAQPAPPARAPAPTVVGGRPVPPVVVLYTIGQGEDVFERFGHATICLRHPRRAAAGLCFDYGTADFESFEKLAWRFIRGRGSFRLSTGPEAKVRFDAHRKDRSLWRQVLPLTEAEAQIVARRLFEDSKDRRWRYAYRLWADNCSTRIRDILDEASGGRLRAATAGRSFDDRTYRDHGHQGYAGAPIAAMFVDLFLGSETDETPDHWEAMFHPDRLREEVQALWGVEAEVVRQRRGPPFRQDPGWSVHGRFLFLALLLAGPLALTMRLGRGVRWARGFALGVLTLLGTLVWFVAWFSPLPELRVNEMLLVFVPLDAALFFLGDAGRRRYARVRTGLLAGVSLLAAVGVFVQPLWAPLLVAFAPFAVLGFLPIAPYSAGSGVGRSARRARRASTAGSVTPLE